MEKISWSQNKTGYKVPTDTVKVELHIGRTSILGTDRFKSKAAYRGHLTTGETVFFIIIQYKAPWVKTLGADFMPCSEGDPDRHQQLFDPNYINYRWLSDCLSHAGLYATQQLCDG